MHHSFNQSFSLQDDDPPPPSVTHPPLTQKPLKVMSLKINRPVGGDSGCRTHTRMGGAPRAEAVSGPAIGVKALRPYMGAALLCCYMVLRHPNTTLAMLLV